MSKRFRSFSLALTALSLTYPAHAQQTPPTVTPPTPPAPTLPAVTLDPVSNNVGIAQTTAHEKGLQARIQWIDGTANIDNLNTAEKCQNVVSEIKAAGMNMIVMDAKPIVGETTYPSHFAAKLPSWKGKDLPLDFDMLGEVLKDAHAAGLPFYANMSTFGEGSKFVSRGLAYTHPDWQTVLYEVDRGISYKDAVSPISVMNALPANDQSLAALTDNSLLHKNWPGYEVAILNFDARVVGVYDGNALAGANITIPLQGAALIGKGKAADWLRANAQMDSIMTYVAQPKYVPVVDAPEQSITMFCDPNNPDVRQHEWDIVREIVTNYPVDGIVFDDRLRYAAINADFSPRSKAAFEKYVGHPIQWPTDIFQTSPYPGQTPKIGQYYQQWLDWRASNIHSWVAQAQQIVKSVRPQAQVSVYVGSWYGDYDKVGSNWAAPDFTAPYHWLTPEYQATGYAGLLDWLTTGCYYETATIDEARTENSNAGATVEAAGQLSNLVVNDSAWCYAGLYALSYQGHPDQFARALQAAVASSQGVMVFDLSQIIAYNWFPVEAEVFAQSPATPPNLVPGLLDDVRTRHAAARASGTPQPPLPPYLGVEDTGF